MSYTHNHFLLRVFNLNKLNGFHFVNFIKKCMCSFKCNQYIFKKASAIVFCMKQYKDLVCCMLHFIYNIKTCFTSIFFQENQAQIFTKPLNKLITLCNNHCMRQNIFLKFLTFAANIRTKFQLTKHTYIRFVIFYLYLEMTNNT